MSGPTIVGSLSDAQALSGRHVGFSEWIDITQEQVDRFADATGDHQWIHVDPERAKAESPFGAPIAHGFLVLSMIPRVLPQLLAFENFSLAVNYGSDRVRFTAPVPVGSRVRAGMVVNEVSEVKGAVQLSMTVTFELEGSERPACVANFISRMFP